MIRVAFILSSLDENWMGGVNYYKSLLNAIHELPDREIEPVIFVGMRTPQKLLQGFPPFETVRLSSLDRWSVLWVLERFLQRRTLADSMPVRAMGDWLEQVVRGSLERQVKRHGVALVSHFGYLGKRASIKTLGWIPDFQHLRLPAFFSKNVRARKDFQFHKFFSQCDAVLLSSHAARKDLIRFMPEFAEKARILQFVPDMAEAGQLAPMEQVREKYGIEGAYFHLPNQFWRHKNHLVVIEALHLLEQAGNIVTVVCTGNTGDVRHPEYFNEVMRLVEKYKLSKQFRVLGLVPRADLVAIMKNSVALINPSLFEGWSTTVEESRSLGKTILLSEIDVHVEQAPPRGLYFNPHHAGELARLLERVAATGGGDIPPGIAGQMNARRLFAERYQEIVLGLMLAQARPGSRGGVVAPGAES